MEEAVVEGQLCLRCRSNKPERFRGGGFLILSGLFGVAEGSWLTNHLRRV